MVCPRCGSDDIEVELDEDGLAYFEECYACGYVNAEVECKSKIPATIRKGEFVLNRATLRKLRLHDK